jgi:hypothetical protein
MPRPSRPRGTAPRAALAAIGACCGILLTGCVTGERASLEPVAQVDDAVAAVVLQRLDLADSVAFTATYNIFPSTTGEPTVATVRQLEGRQRVTIGTVDYLIDAGTAQTCNHDTGECLDYIDEAQISDLNITHRFWSDGAADRLLTDASRRVGFSVGHAETIADRPAACADVPVLGGTVVYCALDAGVLARFFNADVTIELTSFSNDVDADSFSTDFDPSL